MATRGLPTMDHDASEVVVGADRRTRPVSWNLLVSLLWNGDLLPCSVGGS